MTNDVEHLFLFLYAVSSLVKYLLMSFVHFLIGVFFSAIEL